MSEVQTFDPPVLPPASTPTKWEREYRAFQRLLPSLLQTHRGQYVAIHDEKVVDSGDDEIALTRRVFAKVGNVPIHVDLVTDCPPSCARATLPHSGVGDVMIRYRYTPFSGSPATFVSTFRLATRTPVKVSSAAFPPRSILPRIVRSFRVALVDALGLTQSGSMIVSGLGSAIQSCPDLHRRAISVRSLPTVTVKILRLRR